MKKYFIIECCGEISNVSNYTPHEIVREFWNNSYFYYSDVAEFNSISEASEALSNGFYNPYTSIDKACGGSKFIAYRFYQIQEREIDENGEITDLCNKAFLANGIRLMS